MKDEVITIGAYCPDKKRQDTLETLLVNLKLNYPQADLLVHSRSSLPKKIIELADKVIIDNENPLIEDWWYNSILWWKNNNSRIGSAFFNPRKNTHLASTYNFFNSWNYSKYLGYSKIYYIEYDVLIKDFSIFQEAKSHLKKYDAVIYSRETDYLYPFFAFNGSADIPPNYTEYKSSSELEKLYLKNSLSEGTSSEQMGVKMFKDHFKDKVVWPNIDNKCKTLIDSTPLYNSMWNWIVFDVPTQKLRCTIYNPALETLTNNAIFKVNGKVIYENKDTIPPRHYEIHNTSIDLKDVNSLEVITPEKTHTISFSTFEEQYNFLVKNYSLNL